VDWFGIGVIGSIFVITFCLISGTAQFVYADNIFTDSFMVDPSENGWEEKMVQVHGPQFPSDATGDIISNNVDAVLLKKEGKGALELSISQTFSTLDYENISVKLAAFQTMEGYEFPDYLRIEYDIGDGVLVTLLEDHQVWNGEFDMIGEEPDGHVLGNTLSTATPDLALPDAASNNEFLTIRLSVLIDATTNDFFFDSFELNGEPLQQNNPPIAEDDFGLTSLGESATIIVLANDSDEDGDELTVVSVTLPSMGEVVMNEDNSVIYTPNENFLGIDTFTYTISDGTDTATATVSVKQKDAFDLLEELFDFVDTLEPSKIKNSGSLVSQAANLLKMLDGADKATHDDFIDRFHDFKDLIKEKLGKGKQETLESVLLENELDKMELKLKIESSKILENNSKNKKIQTAIDLSIQKKDLIKTKNRLAVAQLLPNSLEKDKLVEQLELEKIELLKNVLILDAKHNDKKITTDFLKKT